MYRGAQMILSDNYMAVWRRTLKIGIWRDTQNIH